ncbi:hypothetical protein MTR_7g058875 [Medicago truncatula]|uniref:Uncharacterized protein n=1 Tax=Medicago truncatula TaxID=3880 RepID=A0A072TZ94_MEDTR|nr:hypothetical protein MTR_7g058875 [Medicago truncatula]
MDGDSRGLERHHKKEEFCSKSQAKKQAITCEKLHYCTPRFWAWAGTFSSQT